MHDDVYDAFLAPFSTCSANTVSPVTGCRKWRMNIELYQEVCGGYSKKSPLSVQSENLSGE